MKNILLLVLFSNACFISTIAQSKSEKDLTATIEKFRMALIDPDSVTLSSLAADELTYGHSTGLVENKAAFINALVTGRSDFKTITLSDQRIQLLEKTAVVWHKLAADIVDNGNAATVKLIVLTVWHQQKGSWKLVSRQAARPK